MGISPGKFPLRPVRSKDISPELEFLITLSQVDLTSLDLCVQTSDKWFPFANLKLRRVQEREITHERFNPLQSRESEPNRCPIRQEHTAPQRFIFKSKLSLD